MSVEETPPAAAAAVLYRPPALLLAELVDVLNRQAVADVEDLPPGLPVWQTSNTVKQATAHGVLTRQHSPQ